MKFAALIGLAAAAKSDFPAFDSLHANCQLEIKFNSDCGTVYKVLENTATKGTDISGGLYELKEDGANDFFWVTRTTPVKHYVDDIIFEVKGAQNGGCTVSSRSRSQTLSYYDYNTNYCNMYNVVRMSGLGFSSLTDSNCKWNLTPDNRDEVCNKY